MTKNKNSTRYYSSLQEERISKKLNFIKQPNSGASLFNKSDLINKDISMAIECKTCMKDKDSFTIKKEWFEKQKNDSFANRLEHSVIAFNFGPYDLEDKFIIDYKLMYYLINKLSEE